MNVVGKVGKDTLWLFLEGELDEHSVSAARAAADSLIERNVSCSRVVFDLSGVRFMDSSGIGFLLGRYKHLKRCHTAAFIQSADFAADKILTMSGIYSLIPKL